MVQSSSLFPTAMKTPTIAPRLVASLRRRIKQFYARLNQRAFESCWAMLDPQIRDDPTSITLYQYTSSVERFLSWCGAVKVTAIEPVQLSVKEPNRLYNDRDFAIVRVTWEDREKQQHI